MENREIITTDTKKLPITFVNQFEITGDIVWKRRTDKSLSYVIRTVNPYTKSVDNPLITIYDNIDAFDEAFGLRARVTAKGYVQTVKRNPDVILATTSMVEEATAFDAEITGVPFKPDRNVVALQGQIVNDVYSPRPRLSLVRMKVVNENGYTHYPTIVCFDKMDAVLRKCKYGDCIKVLCRARADRIASKEADNKQVYRRSLVVQSLEQLAEQ